MIVNALDSAVGMDAGMCREPAGGSFNEAVREEIRLTTGDN